VTLLFRDFVRICKRIEATNSINEKINIIASYLNSLDKRLWKPFILLLAGRPVPEYSEGGLGVGFSTVKKALESRVKPLFSPSPQSIMDVYNVLNRLAGVKGSGSVDKKISILAGLFSSLNRDEVDWVIKIIFNELRIGVDEGHILSALASATNIPLEYIRRAYLLRGGLIDLVDILLSDPGNIKFVKPKLFSPIRPMLATPAMSIVEAFNMVGGGEVAVEVKYDGARVQIHFLDGAVRIFSRRLTDVTSSLPDVVDIVIHNVSGVREAIFEGEVIAIREGNPLPFQELMKRFRRVKDVDRAVKEIPTRLYLFDIIYFNGSLLIDKPYVDRYEVLKSVVPEDLLAERILTSSMDEAEGFYRRALDMGHEGVMVKRLDSPYILGSRGKHWIKVKPAETIDLVIVGAEWGHGRRRGWLSDYYLATYNPSTGGYDVVGKTFKGLTDEEFQYMTKRLLELMIKDEGYRIWVKPEIVVEVAYNEIQRSPKYSSGMALRLARITRIREDKSPMEATTTDELRELYRNQIRFKGLKG
jgi:DNA ligase-1